MKSKFRVAVLLVMVAMTVTSLSVFAGSKSSSYTGTRNRLSIYLACDETWAEATTYVSDGPDVGYEVTGVKLYDIYGTASAWSYGGTWVGATNSGEGVSYINYATSYHEAGYDFTYMTVYA